MQSHISISNKLHLFKLGIRLFIKGTSENFYWSTMRNQNGYAVSIQEFYKASGYLTEKERDAVFESNTIPPWANDIFREAELEFFGRTTL